jgi:hypothetical protein
LPLLAGGIWRITSGEQYIGKKWKSTWWENAIMAILFALAVYGAYHAFVILVSNFTGA